MSHDQVVLPPVRQMIHEAVAALGSPTTNVAVRDWIEARYPGTNRGTIDAQRMVCTVNQPSRVHFPEGEKPRVADDPRYDFLFCPDRGRLEWYRPTKHGVWTVEQDDEGGFAICCDGGPLLYPGGGKPTAPAKIGSAITVAVPKALPPVKPVAASQVAAAVALHHRLPKWAATDRAFEGLARHFGWDREGCILKAAAINDLYSTRVYAIWRMAEHLMSVMADPPDDPTALVAAIAALPDDDGKVRRQHWSFASKIGHFFVDGARFPIYDSFCRDMLAWHLGRGGCVSDASNPYRAFITNLERLREASRVTASLRDLDRYLWLTGQYREWLGKGPEAQVNSELRGLFESREPEAERLLGQLWPQRDGVGREP